MDQYEHIRTAKRVYKKSIRQIAKETGHSRVTVRKVLSGLEPKYRRSKEPACAVMDAFGPVVEGWLKNDVGEPRKQRHTAHRIWRLSIKLCFGGDSSGCLKTGLEQGFELRKSRGIGAGDRAPNSIFE